MRHLGRYIYRTKEAWWCLRKRTDDEGVMGEAVGSHFDLCDFEPTDRWLDAGANIGSFGLVFAKDVEFIASYEPEPGNFEMLRTNLALNGIKNVEAIEAALVGNDDKERTFWVNPRRNQGAHSFYKWLDWFEPCTVRCVNINDALKRHRVNCIKMDVEGAELELLSAIEDWGSIRQVFLEYHWGIMHDECAIQFNKLIAAWEEIGFSVTTLPTPAKRFWCATVAKRERACAEQSTSF